MGGRLGEPINANSFFPLLPPTELVNMTTLLNLHVCCRSLLPLKKIVLRVQQDRARHTC